MSAMHIMGSRRAIATAEFDCPRCKARPGEACRATRGAHRVIRLPHPERIAEARKAGY